MGLDSYVFRVTKPEGLEDRVYSLDEIKALGLSAYLAKYQDEPIFRELKPYCVKVRIDAPYINLQSIREAYGFGEDADVVAQCSDGTITVSERRPDGSADDSFPSGHTGASFSAVSALYAGRSKLWIPSLILAVLIAFSRLYLYVHYPTDILAGAAIGIMAGWAGRRFADLIRRKRHAA